MAWLDDIGLNLPSYLTGTLGGVLNGAMWYPGHAGNNVLMELSMRGTKSVKLCMVRLNRRLAYGTSRFTTRLSKSRTSSTYEGALGETLL